MVRCSMSDRIASFVLGSALSLALLDTPVVRAGELESCAESAPTTCGGTCGPDEECTLGFSGPIPLCQCVGRGCCQVDSDTCNDNVFPSQCEDGIFVSSGVCGVSCLPPPPTCGNSSPECDGPCSGTLACVPIPILGGCGCIDGGCCQVGDTCTDNVAFDQCPDGQIVLNGVCGTDCPGTAATATPTATVTATATVTQTATRTATKAPNGGGCDDPSDCLSGNCVDDTCCADPVCPPGQSCDNLPNPGTCSQDRAPVPAVSHAGVMVALLILSGIAGLTIRGRRHRS